MGFTFVLAVGKIMVYFAYLALFYSNIVHPEAPFCNLFDELNCKC